MPIQVLETKTRGLRYVAKYQSEHLGTFDTMEQAQNRLAQVAPPNHMVKSPSSFYKEKPDNLPDAVHPLKVVDGFKFIVDFRLNGRRIRKAGFLTPQEAVKWRDSKGFNGETFKRKKTKPLTGYKSGDTYKGITILRIVKEGNRLDQNRVFFICPCGKQGNKKWGTMLSQTKVKCSVCAPKGRRKLYGNY